MLALDSVTKLCSTTLHVSHLFQSFQSAHLNISLRSFIFVQETENVIPSIIRAPSMLRVGGPDQHFTNIQFTVQPSPFSPRLNSPSSPPCQIDFF